MENKAKQIECVMFGRVQLVMFRDFAQRKARKIGIMGMVENLSDGSVKVVAQGTEENLLKFISYLKKGPILAKVQDISVSWTEAGEFFQDFKIVY
ncbi:MAG: acylphosphatase [Parcubacteria group bacterium]|nr:acylphosphatase [Parcubacteria group bacterium]